jgi:hypothetical protein
MPMSRLLARLGCQDIAVTTEETCHGAPEVLVDHWPPGHEGEVARMEAIYLPQDVL